MNLILSEVWMHDKDTVCLSTEEMVAEFDRVNSTKPTGEIVIGSADVKALYPSLDIDFTVDKVCEVLMLSDVKFEGLWYKEVGLYLVLNLTTEYLAECGLEDVCPNRRGVPGPKPTMKGMRKNKEEDRFKNWKNPDRDPDEVEKRRMIVEAVRICLKFIMKNHMYTFENRILKQKHGGPIGLDLTGTVAQIFMIWWERELRRCLGVVFFYFLMQKRYVDDMNLASEAVVPGTVCWVNETLVEAEGADVRADARTMEFIKKVGNTIHYSIQLEVDYPSKHEDEKMPILDLKCWVEKRGEVSEIVHEHYMKDVSSKLLTHAESAMPWATKRTILTQDALRILLNCSRDLPWDVKANHLTHFTARMQFSGYDQRFRFEVVSSALKAYNALKEKEENGVRPMYRPRAWNEEERRSEKKNKKKTWYRKGGKKSFIILPYTKNSQLKKEYSRCIEESGFPIRVVEKAGKSLKRKLQRSNPLAEERCGRDDCFVCSTEGEGPCNAEGVNYEIVCNECNYPFYHGETASNGYTRGGEHLDASRLNKLDSKMKKHAILVHGGRTIEVKMNINRVFGDDSMSRQIEEAVRIRRAPPGQLVNAKDEWNYLQLPSVTMEQ